MARYRMLIANREIGSEVHVDAFNRSACVGSNRGVGDDLLVLPLPRPMRPSFRASRGILMSRSMDIKDRVAAADSLARYEPRAAVPILIEALNETSEPVRPGRSARTMDGCAERKPPRTPLPLRAAMPALRIALGDVSVSVAMNAAGALEKLGEPARRTGRVSRAALRRRPDRTPTSASSPRVA